MTKLRKVVDLSILRWHAHLVTAGFLTPLAVPGTYKVCSKNVLIEWAGMNKPISTFILCGMYWAVKYVFFPLFPWHTQPQSTMLKKHCIMELPSHLGKWKLIQSKKYQFCWSSPSFYWWWHTTQRVDTIASGFLFLHSLNTYWKRDIRSNAGRAHGGGQSSTFTELTVQWTQRFPNTGPQTRPGQHTRIPWKPY